MQEDLIKFIDNIEEPLNTKNENILNKELTVQELQNVVISLQKELNFFKTAYREEISGLKDTIEHLKLNHDKSSLRKKICKGVISRKILEQHSKAIYSLSSDFNRELIVSGSADTNICVWNSSSGELLDTLKGHTGGITAVKIYGDKVYSAGWDKHVCVWNLNSGECEKVLKGHSHCVRALAIAQNTLISGSSDKIILTWDITTGQCTQILKGHKGAVYCLHVDKSCEILASGGSDKLVKLWNVSTGECKRTLKGHQDVVYSVKFWENTMVSGSGDGSVRVWDLTSGQTLRVLVHQSSVNALFYHHKLLFAACNDSEIRIWELQSGECVRVICGHKECVYSLEVSTEGTLFSAGGEGTIIHTSFTS